MFRSATRCDVASFNAEESRIPRCPFSRTQSVTRVLEPSGRAHAPTSALPVAISAGRPPLTVRPLTELSASCDGKQIGRELGVRYLVEGSVQRSADRVRVTAQLIDAETHAHLWADRFDRDVRDLFAVQNEITR